MIISVLSLFLTVPLLGIYDSSFPHIIKKIGGDAIISKKTLSLRRIVVPCALLSNFSW